MEKKPGRINATAILVAVVLGLALVVSSYFFYLAKKEETALWRKEQEEREQQAEKTERKAVTNKALLWDCLDDVDERFAKVIQTWRDNYLPVTEEGTKLALSVREQLKEECYKKYED